mgnify:CR=1 FL=1
MTSCPERGLAALAEILHPAPPLLGGHITASQAEGQGRGDGDGGGRRHNSTHRLLIGASFFLALIITFISHVSIHEFRQHEEQPCGDNNNKVDEILKAVSFPVKMVDVAVKNSQGEWMDVPGRKAVLREDINEVMGIHTDLYKLIRHDIVVSPLLETLDRSGAELVTRD